MQTCLSFFCLLLSTVCLAQPLADSARSLSSENDILRCKHLKKGLYRTFEEFRTNSPTSISEFELVKTNDLHSNRAIQLVFKNPKALRESEKNIWGICDGDSIYINSLHYQNDFHLDALLHLGRYGYLESKITGRAAALRADGIPVYKPAEMQAGRVRSSLFEYYAGYILNLNNGKFYQLNEDALEKILSQDLALLSKYRREDKRGSPRERQDLRYRYLRLYSEQHSEEVK
ncbi:MAG: hypothetical protein V4714_18100 [Bacteroidota bacterium]